MQQKKIVKYFQSPHNYIERGERASVMVQDYPGNERVIPGYTGQVRTSEVVHVHTNGVFETLNSTYIPIEE